MNQLSWLIYAADVAGGVNSLCGFVFCGGLVALAIYSVCKGIAFMTSMDFGDDNPPVTPSIATVGKKLWLPVVLAGAVGTFTPSSATIYAIAASEMGERVLTSPTATKAVKALDAWLDKQVAK